jgi:hypothetical protein
MPTSKNIFSKYAILASLSVIAAESSSSLEYNPSPNPVALVMAVTVSCKNRKGGFDSSFSAIFGFEMSAEILAFASATNESRSPIFDSQK